MRKRTEYGFDESYQRPFSEKEKVSRSSESEKALSAFGASSTNLIVKPIIIRSAEKGLPGLIFNDDEFSITMQPSDCETFPPVMIDSASGDEKSKLSPLYVTGSLPDMYLRLRFIAFGSIFPCAGEYSEVSCSDEAESETMLCSDDDGDSEFTVPVPQAASENNAEKTISIDSAFLI